MFFAKLAALIVCLAPVVRSGLPNMKIVDMTHAYNDISPHWDRIERFRLIVERNGTAEDGEWLQLENICTGTHVGTHLDAPCEFAKGQWCIDEIPVDRLVGPAAVIDIRHKMGRDPLVRVEDLKLWESISGRSLDDTIILIRSRTTEDDVTPFSASVLEDPGLSIEAAKWLVENRRIYGYGTDVLPLEYPIPKDPAHRLLLRTNVYGFEYAANVDKIPVYGATLFVMPMKISKSGGAQVRIIGVFPNFT